MDRDNLQARLQDIRALEIEERVEAYEDLFDEVDLRAVEHFPSKNGEDHTEIEVKRRIWITYRVADNLGLDDLQERTKSLLKQNFNNG